MSVDRFRRAILLLLCAVGANVPHDFGMATLEQLRARRKLLRDGDAHMHCCALVEPEPDDAASKGVGTVGLGATCVAPLTV